MNDTRWYREGRALIDEINSLEVGKGRIAIYYFGQCGFVLKSRTRTVGIDLILEELYGKNGERRRVFSPPFSPDQGLHLDYLLVTHDHRDHLDDRTIQGLKRANPSLQVVVPKGLEDCLPARLEGLVYLGKEMCIRSENLEIEAVPTPHTEYIFDERGESISQGYFITMEGKRFFHCGDALCDEKLRKAVSDFSPYIMFLPINGRDEERTKAGIIGNMTSQEAISFSIDMRAIMIPMHYDFFLNNGYDIELFKKEAEEAKAKHIEMLLGLKTIV